MLIATRVLQLRRPDGETDVEVRIYAPVEDAGSWFCRYEIDWPGGTRRLDAGGVDSAQALHHAMQMVGAELYTSEAHQAGDLFWDKPGNGFGFPVSAGIRDLLQGDDARFL